MRVSELITEAWYFTGMVPADSNTPDNGQLSDGLKQLNRILSGAARTGSTVPYVTHQQVNLVAGVEMVFIPNLVKISSITYQLTDNVRFSLKNDSRREYFNTSRVTDITSLPYQYHFERTKGGSNLYFYWLPDKAYPLDITGWYGLSDVALGDDLSTTYDDFYIEYLVLETARKLCVMYSMSFPAESRAELDSIKSDIKDLSPMDLSVASPGLFSRRSGGGWAQATIGQGWTR